MYLSASQLACWMNCVTYMGTIFLVENLIKIILYVRVNTASSAINDSSLIYSV